MEETKRMETTKQEEIDAQAEAEVGKFIYGFVNMAVVKCAMDLGIAEAIEKHGSPMSLSELSSTLKCEPSSLYRIMRFLVHEQIFKEELTSQGFIGFQQTPVSRRLMRSEQSNGMAAILLMESSPAMLASWFNLSAGVLANGTPPFRMANGKDGWRLLSEDASFRKVFNEAMAYSSRTVVPAVVAGCPEVFDGLDSLVDVGGGNGTALKILVKAFPRITGINFDLPHVVAAAEECPGIEHVGGSMFDSVPMADAILLMRVLHDWGDDECIQILKKCREAIPKDKGKVIIVDIVIEEEKEDKLKPIKLMVDLTIMAFSDAGKERSFKEWDYVLGQAGFNKYNVKPIRDVLSVFAYISVIEAYP